MALLLMIEMDVLTEETWLFGFNLTFNIFASIGNEHKFSDMDQNREYPHCTHAPITSPPMKEN